MRHRYLANLALAGALAGATALPAAAQTQGPACVVERDSLFAHLAGRYGEARTNLMLDGRGNLVELFGNRETGTWTLTVTPPGGPTCIVSSGASFGEDPPPAPAGEAS